MYKTFSEPNLGFWRDLPRPFFALAPMADVTDVALRSIVAKYSRHGQPGGGPDVFWTEFVSINGLLSSGKDVLIRDLEYRTNEQPIVAQIFGDNPEKFAKIAAYCEKIGFAGIDINAGCPDRSICKQGAGSGMMHDLANAQQIIEACKQAAPNTPLSIKTRLGWSKDETDTWIVSLLEAKPAVLTVHVRSKADMSKTCPEWGRLKKIVSLRNQISPRTLIMANGGIRTKAAGRQISRFTGCDGIMMGKAVFGNPWLFDDTVNHRKITIAQKINVMLEHATVFLSEMGDLGPETNKPAITFGAEKYELSVSVHGKNFALMKKHFKAYIHGFPGAKELRTALMEADTYQEIRAIAEGLLMGNPELAQTAPNEEYVA